MPDQIQDGKRYWDVVMQAPVAPETEVLVAVRGGPLTLEVIRMIQRYLDIMAQGREQVPATESE